jgi:cellulose synthase/poly-beta-1,6-N-acetylglucosamine synthase-like glycosyltransferase
MRILLAVPTFEHIQNEVFQSIYDLDKCGHEVDFKYITGHDCARARNIIADLAIGGGYDYVMMVDSDTVIPKDALKNLLDPADDIVLGCCPRKNTKKKEFPLSPVTCLDMKQSLTIDDLQGTDRIELNVGGCACVLIRTEVFYDLLYPYFKYDIRDDGSILSEDYYFCQMAISSGYKVWVDPRVKCGHLARYYQYE